MKTLPLFRLLALLLLLPLVSSCIDDEYIDPDDDGDSRDVLVGTWNCVESEAKIAFTVKISKDPGDADQLLMENFAYIGMGEFATAVLSGVNLDVPEQVPCEGYLVKGSGTMVNHDQLTFSYSVTAGGDKTDYNATFTRR
ncbi:MAG TPA: hypothetical protein P5550_10615 [Bacteroidales bacterium]|nr:hypothetical protein [Bacteroidales bacterium]HRZ75999.1 hypothetical protein [Bacteroidales bacterium]